VNTKFVVNPLFRTSTSSFFSGWQCGWKWKWKFETKKRNAETQPTTHPHMTIQLNSTLSNCDDGSKNGMEWNGNGIGNEMKWLKPGLTEAPETFSPSALSRHSDSLSPPAMHFIFRTQVPIPPDSGSRLRVQPLVAVSRIKQISL